MMTKNFVWLLGAFYLTTCASNFAVAMDKPYDAWTHSRSRSAAYQKDETKNGSKQQNIRKVLVEETKLIKDKTSIETVREVPSNALQSLTHYTQREVDCKTYSESQQRIQGTLGHVVSIEGKKTNLDFDPKTKDASCELFSPPSSSRTTSTSTKKITGDDGSQFELTETRNVSKWNKEITVSSEEAANFLHNHRDCFNKISPAKVVQVCSTLKEAGYDISKHLPEDVVTMLKGFR